MAANIHVAHCVFDTTLAGNILVDGATSVTLADTRIRGVHATGIGEFIIEGVSVDPFGGKVGNIMRFSNTTATDVTDIYLTDVGIRMAGQLAVTLPTTASKLTVFYG